MKTADEWKKLVKVAELSTDEVIELMIKERESFFNAGLSLQDLPLKVQMTGVVSDGPLPSSEFVKLHENNPYVLGMLPITGGISAKEPSDKLK